MTERARELGLAGDVAAAHRLLDELEARVALERGRLHRTAAEQKGVAVPDEAGQCFRRAAALGATATDDPADDSLAGLHVDALHMLALLAVEPAEQVRLTEQALAVAEASPHPPARAWRAALLNNLGMSQHDAGDDQAALASFIRAVELRREAGQRRELQVARWCQGWALRLVGRRGEALAVQQALAVELATDGVDDQFVAEELALLQAAGTPLE